MKKIIFILTATFFLCSSYISAYAISAQSAVVIDAVSGRVLYENNARTKLGMASTTKIMTAICALEHGDMEKLVTVSPTASGVEGSSMYLAKGEKISMTNLVYGLMLSSGNDAATAIAETVSGSVEKFAELMNQKALEIGCENTNFTNPHGLSSEEHFTTAHDLAKITAYALNNSTFREIVSTKTKSLPATEGGIARTLVNHNKFLSMYDGCIGVKTGFTKATGRCLVTAVERDGLILICVTLNAPDDWNDHRALYDDAFSKYSPYLLKNSDEIITTVKVKGGIYDTVNLVPEKDLLLPTLDGEENRFTVEPIVFEGIEAPIKKGDRLGTILVSSEDKEICEFPLVAAEDVEMKKIFLKSESMNFFVSLRKVFYSWLTCFN